MKITTTYALITAALLCSSVRSIAAEGTDIGGKVLDTQNKPLDYVTVSLLRLKDSTLLKTAVSDAKGAFSFKGIAPGEYSVVLSQIGMKRFTSKPVLVATGQSFLDLGTMVMEPENNHLRAVTVTAQKPLIERKGDKLIVNVSASSVSAGSTALEVLQRAPGVSLDKDDNISLRGKQGVLVMLDGKPTYMSAADLTNMLRNMQSNEIEALEIIANPSARYEAEGKSGIINIRLKKNKNFGTNGTLTAGGAYSGFRKLNGGLSLNNRSKGLNLFGNYNFGDSESEQLMDIDRVNDYAGIRSIFRQTTRGGRSRRNHNFKVGADWSLNKNHTLGLLVNGYFNRSEEHDANTTLISSTQGVLDSTVNTLNTGRSKYRNMSYNVNYRGKLDSSGRELNIDLDYSNNYSSEHTIYDNVYSYIASNTEVKELLRSLTPAHIDIYAVKADYVHPFGKAFKLEAGYKSSWVRTDNDFQFSRYMNNDWQNESGRSNHFVYDENVNAAYLSFRTEMKKWNLQAGLRMEQTNSRGHMITTGQVVKRHYLDFFPSAAINYEANEKNSFSFSYSRRITRPEYDALNPFEYFIDKYTFNRGNPFLNPEYTNTFDLSYTFLKKYILSAGFSRTTDGITEVLLADAEKSALFQTRENLSEQLSYSLNLSLPLSFTKWWSGNTNINLFRNQFKSPDLNGQALDNDQTSLQLFSTQNFTLNKTASLELSGEYQTRVVYGAFMIKPRYAVDLGLNKSFLNKKLNLKMAMVDIFKTRYGKISSAYPGLDYSVFQRRDSRMLRMSLTYKFGSNEVKPSRNRATGLEAEAGRIKR